MRTLTFEQLRINLTLTFDALDEPIQIIKKGKVQGYIVKELPGKQPCHTKAEPEIVQSGVSGEVNKPPSKRIIKQPCDIVGILPKRTQPTVQHHVMCACAMCKPGKGQAHV